MLSLESLSPQKALKEIGMANQLKMHKSLAIQQLRAQGMSGRQIAVMEGHGQDTIGGLSGL